MAVQPLERDPWCPVAVRALAVAVVTDAVRLAVEAKRLPTLARGSRAHRDALAFLLSPAAPWRHRRALWLACLDWDLDCLEPALAGLLALPADQLEARVGHLQVESPADHPPPPYDLALDPDLADAAFDAR